jgi:hypothetical protein
MTSQQIVEAFAEHDTPRCLLRDRDGVYGSDVRSRIASQLLPGVEDCLGPDE